MEPKENPSEPKWDSKSIIEFSNRLIKSGATIHGADVEKIILQVANEMKEEKNV